MPRQVESQFFRMLALGIVSCTVVAGIWLAWNHMGFQSAGEETPLLQFITEHKSPRDIYFIPVHFPKPSPPGSLSSDFKPVADKRQDNRVIPVDLQGFRLVTGAPIFVDLKSIPYKDVEILEWYDRLLFAQKIQNELKDGDEPKAIAALLSRGVTHLVVPANAPLNSNLVEKQFEDNYYLLYCLKRTQP